MKDWMQFIGPIYACVMIAAATGGDIVMRVQSNGIAFGVVK